MFDDLSLFLLLLPLLLLLVRALVFRLIVRLGFSVLFLLLIFSIIIIVVVDMMPWDGDCVHVSECALAAGVCFSTNFLVCFLGVEHFDDKWVFNFLRNFFPRIGGKEIDVLLLIFTHTHSLSPFKDWRLFEYRDGSQLHSHILDKIEMAIQTQTEKIEQTRNKKQNGNCAREWMLGNAAQIP